MSNDNNTTSMSGDMSDARERRRPPYVMWLCAIIAVGAGIAAAMNASDLGWPAFLLLIGVAITALIAIFGLVIANPLAQGASTSENAEQALMASALEKIPEPTMITRDGKPVYANAAYMTLAGELAAMGLSKAPPTVDRLFGTKVKSASAIIFDCIIYATNMKTPKSLSTRSRQAARCGAFGCAFQA